MSTAARQRPTSGHDPSAAARVSASVASGLLSALVTALTGPWWLMPLAFWDAAALVYVAWTWRSVWPLNAHATARRACSEDPGPAWTDALLITSSVASLLVVGLVLVRASHTGGVAKGLLLGLSIASIVLSGSVVHTSDLQAKPIRESALRHALLSYLFGALIVSMTINLVGGLSK